MKNSQAKQKPQIIVSGPEYGREDSRERDNRIDRGNAQYHSSLDSKRRSTYEHNFDKSNHNRDESHGGRNTTDRKEITSEKPASRASADPYDGNGRFKT